MGLLLSGDKFLMHLPFSHYAIRFTSGTHNHSNNSSAGQQYLLCPNCFFSLLQCWIGLFRNVCSSRIQLRNKVVTGSQRMPSIQHQHIVMTSQSTVSHVPITTSRCKVADRNVTAASLCHWLKGLLWGTFATLFSSCIQPYRPGDHRTSGRTHQKLLATKNHNTAFLFLESLPRHISITVPILNIFWN